MAELFGFTIGRAKKSDAKSFVAPSPDDGSLDIGARLARLAYHVDKSGQTLYHFIYIQFSRVQVTPFNQSGKPTSRDAYPGVQPVTMT